VQNYRKDEYEQRTALRKKRAFPRLHKRAELLKEMI